MHVLIYLAGFLAFAAAQAPKPCDAPVRMEAKIITLDLSKKFESRARYTYDAVYRRERIVDEVNIVDKKEYYDIIRLHDVGKEYRLNLKTKICQTVPITTPWRAIEIPRNATNYGEAFIGSSSSFADGVLVQIWGGDTPEGRYLGVWTLKDCIPIHDTFISKRFGLIQTSLFDVVLGIVDPNVFIPPKECH
ncbi:mammalian ependymin-related protein 1-like [Tubulanus polymorphus]|uniref:mammalian ependymin-related protein 1-like n=1 Tax=Tubulanus polymorphus TaxID=672921 RepID=UPI003DA2CC38